MACRSIRRKAKLTEATRWKIRLRNGPYNNVRMLFPLDKTIVFHFYDFVLVLSAVSSRCQLYSVGPSEGKLIPNSVFFIQSFREFRAWVPTKDGFSAWPVKTRYPRSIESFSFEWNPIENATTIRVLDALHFESACQASFWSKLKGGKFALQKDFAVIPEQTHDISEDS